VLQVEVIESILRRSQCKTHGSTRSTDSQSLERAPSGPCNRSKEFFEAPEPSKIGLREPRDIGGRSIRWEDRARPYAR
jgi:hypothetical protein